MSQMVGILRTAVLPCLTFASVVFAYTACNTTKKQNGPESKLSGQEKAAFEEYKAEIEVGRNMAGRLLAYYGVNEDEKLVGYVNQVGNYVASYGDYPDRKYMYAILDSDMVNAFACPGGYILVTQGAIRMAESEAELAMILGHEAAHVGKKHMFNTLQNMGKDELEQAAKDSEKDKKVPYAMRVRSRPKPEETGSSSAVARYISSATGAGLGILQAAKAGMSLILEKGLDKKLEYEADQEGVKYAIRAGYEPNAMMAFLKRLDAGKKANDTKILEKTHPKPADRRTRIAKLLKEMDADSIVGADGRERFMKYHEKLPPVKNKQNS